MSGNTLRSDALEVVEIFVYLGTVKTRVPYQSEQLLWSHRFVPCI